MNVILPYERIVELATSADLEVAPFEQVTFLAVRGARILRLTPVEVELDVFVDSLGGDEHNDAFLMFWKEDGEGRVDAVPCTTQPAWSYIYHPMVREGAAFLPPYTRFSYVRGRHRRQNAYRALREINLVVRDRDKSGAITPGDLIVRAQLGVNIHGGRISAGCTVCKPTEFTRVQRWRDLRPNQIIFPYAIVTGVDVAQWNSGAQTWRPSLTLGSINSSWGAWLQRLLIAATGEKLLVDGNWGQRTQAALNLFCQLYGIEPTAQMTPEVWQCLENVTANKNSSTEGA